MDCLLINGYAIEKASVGFRGLLEDNMEDNAAREDACREYQSSLEDLTFNSKPHINMLTILAEENLNFAKDIVAIIEAQILKAPSTEKLPVLYLVDSIVKNVGGEYLAVFAKNLITSFICVFEKVDENTRKSLFKLRSTWDDVFPLKKLYALDVRVNSQDPAWPIKPLPPTVNASIHVNPKFLKQSEEAASPPPASTAAPTLAPPLVPPAAQPGSAISQSSLTQEHMIRQQLLAKQKQLLELQQKKIELELEQTKAQLAGGFSLPTTPVTTSGAQSSVQKPVSQTASVVRPWIPSSQTDSRPATRDPRLNRLAPPATSQPKEQPPGKKENPPTTISPILTPEKRLPEKREKRKEVIEEKLKSKSPSPLAKSVQSKTKQTEAAEAAKPADIIKKDPRLRKRTQDKMGEARDDELKEKKRCSDKKERGEETARAAEPLRFNKVKLVNGSVAKHDREECADFKTGGNARTHARRRTRSRSRSRSPTSSPKRKDRRSPKGRTRSTSLSPSPSHKSGKPRRVRTEELQHGKLERDERLPTKKNQSESRRSKRPVEDRHLESRDSHSPRAHDICGKEAKEAPHRWRSGWEETKHLKLSDNSHVKSGPQRHKQYSTPTRPTTPRTPKHRLSVDANLQIPDVLNFASKKDLLRRASKRLESGEISQEEFLNMAHKIKHFFQYQEEKQQRSEGWDDPNEFPPKKQQLLLTKPLSPLARPPDSMDAAERSYFEHKSKLKKTQVSHHPAGEEWEEESLEESEKKEGSHKFSRVPLDRPGERRSQEPRPPLGPMIEEYNHGKEFPTLKSLPGLRFTRRANPRESSEREWNSPLTERQRYNDRDEQKSGYDAPRRYTPHLDPRRTEGPPHSGTVVHRNCSSPAGLEPLAPRFERERLSPLHQKDSAESPIPCFESPNSEHSDDGPINLDLALVHPHAVPKSILKAAPRGGPLSGVLQHSDSPEHTPPHDGHPSSLYEGPSHMGPSRTHPPGWYEGSPQFEGPHHAGSSRFDGGGPLHPNMPERFDDVGKCDGPPMSHGPVRPRDGMGRFDSHTLGQQPPVSFVGQGPGSGPFEGPVQRFEPPRRFDNMVPGSGPMSFPQRPMRFEGPPNQMAPLRFDGPGRFEGPGPGPIYDMGGPPRFSGPPGQQGPPRFAPQHNLQPPMRPIYDNPMAPQQNFNIASQHFPESVNPQFSMPFAAQPNMQQTGNFNMQPAPPFNQPAPNPYYNPAAPAVGLHQPVNMMGNMNQPFLPQNPVPFTSQENHFGQVDVNDLLSKLISTGIIKPSQPDTTQNTNNESSCTTSAAPPVEEDDDEDQEVEEEDFTDLTGFSIDDMKQRFESVVTKLYSGNQCCLCSMRFTAAQTDMYADHLDWHFRQNHAGKVASKKVTHRRWYYSLTDWIEFEEIADLEERAKSQFFEKENEEEVQKNQAAAKEKEFQSVRATKDQVGESCEICQEPFETYWVEEEEDWFLKDAVRVDDKNFHPSCFEDYKNSCIDVSPSASKLLTDHPLSAFIKTEEGAASCLIAPSSVKQEVDTELPEVKKEEEEVILTECVQSEESKL
ncbi:pre-mRNA cleavage complex 2 protein Pcf11 [Betta splendens]|uniref:Pre-mRNA cleavage complex 2 protein Pcf11 n=1 Tax=Betta splendens TaxID=158456 RepID=A0A6P7PAX0_BETSP|nr:pre-mRNA cleavage complex 2 protein Pcf11 [Betta splendens]